MKFYLCTRCGNELMMLKQGACAPACCGETMKELIPGTTEAATEKHIPVYTVDGGKVSVVVGEVEHPMTDAHWIEWIALESKEGCQVKKLAPTDAPKAAFALAEGDEVVGVYAYCNLHGLWKA